MLFKIKIWYNYINAANNILAAGLDKSQESSFFRTGGMSKKDLIKLYN